ncbi:MAG: type II secretion system F family protein [bacterium]
MPRTIYMLLVYFTVFVAVAFISTLLLSTGRSVFGYYQSRYLRGVSRTLETMFIFLNPRRILNISILVMCLVFVLTLVITRLNVLASIIMALIGLLVPRILLNFSMRKRRKQFEDQFIQGLEYLSSSVKAGLSLVQAMESLVENSKPPLSQEFDLLLREYRIGIPLNEALQNLGRRVDSEELNLMVFSTIITRELGGDISEIFDHLAEVIRSRHRVMERIDTLTAQGRLQAFVCGAIPFVLYGLLFLWQPEYLKPLFHTFAGRIALYAVILFQVMVIVMVRRLVNIRV